MISRRICAAAVAVGLCAATSPAHASPWRVASHYSAGPAGASAADAPVNPEAVAAYEAGSNAYALGNYADAVVNFEKAFELSRRSELLFNLGQAYTRWYEISGDVAHLKKGRKLLENYLAYVDEHPDQDDPEARRQTRERLDEVDELIAAHGSRDDPGKPETDTKKPVHEKAWFWVVVVGGAALVAGAVATGVVLSRRSQRDEFEPELGTLGRGVGPGGLGFRF